MISGDVVEEIAKPLLIYADRDKQQNGKAANASA